MSTERLQQVQILIKAYQETGREAFLQRAIKLLQIAS